MIEKQELGRRLRAARDQVGMTQEQVARQLGLSRGALGQIEIGMRAPNSLQLAHLAGIYGRDLPDLLAEDFDPVGRDAVVALFRSDAQVADDPKATSSVHLAVDLAREWARLEEMLGIAAERSVPPDYDLPLLQSRWDAIKQGERLAEQERDRLELGIDPIRNIRVVLEQQGIRVLEGELPSNISGAFLNDPRFGLAIIANASQYPRRRRFSYAHEYCHALADRDVSSLLSKNENRSDYREVRANAFAAALLMPADGVRAFVRARGKGSASSSLQVFDERAVLVAQRRGSSRSPDIQLYDVVHVAAYFGTSFESAAYRLRNLHLITDQQLERFTNQKEEASRIRAHYFERTDHVDEPAVAPNMAFLFLVLDAFLQGEISRRKALELGQTAGAPASFEAMVDDLEATIPEDPDDDVALLGPAPPR